MSKENNDVEDLYKELETELAKSAEEEESSGASAEKPTPEEDKAGDENEELSEEEIQKLSPRAQKRIRDLAAENTRLAEEAAAKEKAPDDSKKEETKVPDGFDTMEDFLAAVQDEPSRKLLEEFYGLVKKDISSTLSPIEQKNREALFDSEFAKYAEIDGVADYKDDLKKTFMKDKTKAVKDLVGAVVTDIQLSKVGKIEESASDPNRNGKIDTDKMSKEELYDLLESEKE